MWCDSIRYADGLMCGKVNMKRIKISGIYLIENTISSLFYIGQSSDIASRWSSHIHDIKSKSRPSNSRLRNSWHKYGTEAFTFSIIEKCEIAMLTEREIYWLGYYRTKYPKYIANTDGPADNPMRGMTHTEVTRARMSAASTGRPKTDTHRTNIGNAHRGRKQPQTAGIKNTMRCPETLAKVYASNRNQIEDVDNGETWRTITLCASAIGSTQSYVSQCIRLGWRCKGRKLRKSFLPNTVENNTSDWTRKWVNPMRGEHHTPGTILKISEALNGRPKSADHRMKIGAANMGRIVTLETRKKLREAKIGVKNPLIAGDLNPSCRPGARDQFRGEKNPAKRPEVRAKMSATRSNWVEDINTGEKWRTMSDCATALGVSISSVSQAVKNNGACCNRVIRRLRKQTT